MLVFDGGCDPVILWPIVAGDTLTPVLLVTPGDATTFVESFVRLTVTLAVPGFGPLILLRRLCTLRLADTVGLGLPITPCTLLTILADATGLGAL